MAAAPPQKITGAITTDDPRSGADPPTTGSDARAHAPTELTLGRGQALPGRALARE